MRRKCLAICLLLCAVACASQPPTSESLANSDLVVTDIEKAPKEYQLAYLDSGHLPRGNDASAARIRYLLKELSRQTGDSVPAVSDRTAQSTITLKKEYGRQITNERFLEEANGYFKGGGPKTSFNDLSTLLALQFSK